MPPFWKPFLPHQHEGCSFRAPPGSVDITAFLGGWASGKSEGGARKTAIVASLNPWSEAYGSDNPLGLIMAPTLRTIRNVTLKRLLSLLPREAIHKKRGPPSYEIELINGCTLVPASFDADIEGITAAFVWLDEVQLMDNTQYITAFSRIRDPNAGYPALIASGLPYAGLVRETFDVKGPNRCTTMSGIEDNPVLTDSFKRELRKSCPSGREGVLLDGEWGTPEGLVWPQYDASRNLKDWEVDWSIPGFIGWDPGNRSGVIFAQPRETRLHDGTKTTGLYVVDEIVSVDRSLRDVSKIIKTERKWTLDRRVSNITPDPTTRDDEMYTLRAEFPGITIHRYRRGRPEFSREYGYDTVAAGLLDSEKNVTLWFHRSLAENKHGIIDSIANFARDPRTGNVKKTNMVGADHIADALRYVCVSNTARERVRPSLLD